MSIDKRNSPGASAVQANFKKDSFEATAGQTVFTVTFLLHADSLIFQNGATVPDADWTGIGTYTLTLVNAANEFDIITAIG